jgi:heptose I phosphotransferase
MWPKKQVELSTTLQKYWIGKDIFKQVFQLSGEVYRQQKNRKTIRVEIQGKAYFVKTHHGIGWKEIIKNLLLCRLPVFGARREWRALTRLTSLGINTTPITGFGQSGINPAKLESFLITEELADTVSLETFCQGWKKNPPAPGLKQAIIKEMAFIARTLHQNGANHRDFYICHFLLDISMGIENLTSKNIKLYLIDLHRAQLRKHTPKRWVIKDLAGLLFSTMGVEISRHDLFLFIKEYYQAPLKECFQNQKYLFNGIEKRAIKLYGKEVKEFFCKDLLGTNNAAVVLALDNSAKKFHIDNCLSSDPLKRYILEGNWNYQRVIAKVMINAKDAKKELHGYQQFVKNNITVPHLLYHGWAKGKTLYVFLYESVQPAKNLDCVWTSLDETNQAQVLEHLISFVVQCHNHGIYYSDWQIKDIWLTKENQYLIDFMSIKTKRHPFSLQKNIGLYNLALLYGKLFDDSGKLIEVYEMYIQSRGFIFTRTSLHRFEKWVAQCHHKLAFLKKQNIFHENSDLLIQKNGKYYSLCDKAYDTDGMQIFLKDPETILQGPATKILKADHSLRVMRVTISGRHFVVKHFHHKNILKGIKYHLFFTRAYLCWKNARQLKMAKISAPLPVGVIEKRFGFLRGNSYFIAEYKAGKQLEHFFADSVTPEQLMFAGDKIKKLFGDLANARATHGDLKASNLLMDGKELILLDLDSVRFHRRKWRWKKFARRDQKRFLKNWEAHPEIYEYFSGMLEKNY